MLNQEGHEVGWQAGKLAPRLAQGQRFNPVWVVARSFAPTWGRDRLDFPDRLADHF